MYLCICISISYYFSICSYVFSSHPERCLLTRFLFPPPALACARFDMFPCLFLMPWAGRALRPPPPPRVTLFDTFPCLPAIGAFSSSRHTFPYAAALLFSSLSLSLSLSLSRSFFFFVLSHLSLTMLYHFFLFQVSLQLVQHPTCPPPPCVNNFWTHPPCRSRLPCLSSHGHPIPYHQIVPRQ